MTLQNKLKLYFKKLIKITRTEQVTRLKIPSEAEMFYSYCIY